VFSYCLLIVSTTICVVLETVQALFHARLICNLSDSGQVAYESCKKTWKVHLMHDTYPLDLRRTAGVSRKKHVVGATRSTYSTDCAGTNVPYKSSPSCCFSSLAQNEFCIYRTMYHNLQNIDTLLLRTSDSSSSLIVGGDLKTGFDSLLNSLSIRDFRSSPVP
jgi:hypothetical protein